ncbi:MAG: urease accessory protein UreG, partial [Rhodobacteraceae bacterium]|nr:urease accessory protein UreG [Paracoccaceae bacterium]
GRPVLMTDCRHGTGIDALVELIETRVLFRK